MIYQKILNPNQKSSKIPHFSWPHLAAGDFVGGALVEETPNDHLRSAASKKLNQTCKNYGKIR